jgi:hypothetical protein
VLKEFSGFQDGWSGAGRNNSETLYIVFLILKNPAGVASVLFAVRLAASPWGKA